MPSKAKGAKRSKKDKPARVRYRNEERWRKNKKIRQHQHEKRLEYFARRRERKQLATAV